jgi:hypothetical protein
VLVLYKETDSFITPEIRRAANENDWSLPVTNSRFDVVISVIFSFFLRQRKFSVLCRVLCLRPSVLVWGFVRVSCG